MDKTLIYISDFGGDSQVLNLLKEIKFAGYFSKIFLLVGEKNNDSWESLLKKTENSNIDVFRFKKFPNYSFFKFFQSKAINKIIKNILSSNTIIHLRGEALTAIVRDIINNHNYQNVRILTDVRGASYEEIKLYSKIKPPFLQLKLIHLKKSLKSLKRSSDYISCVSLKLREYVLKRTKMDESKIFVNHCIAGEEFKYDEQIREKYRNTLNLSTVDVVFLFVTGSNAPWQNTNKIINQIAENGYKILNLSKKEINHENVINLFVPYTEVSNYLNAADISVVWRNDDVVNQVAAPIKFSEYVCCGLPVVANTGVELINNYIKTSGYGVTINDLNELQPETIEKLISLDRNTISEYAREIFSLNVISKKYISIYEEMLKP